MNIGQHPSYDFFVTYALDDRDWAEGVIVDALRSNGKTCFTREDFEAGKPLLDAYAEAVTSSRKVIIVLSPAYLVDEFSRVSDKLARHYGTELGTWPVVALVYKPVEEIPLGIRMLNPIDATREQDWISVVDQLAGLPDAALIAEWVRLYNAEDFQNVMSVFYAKKAIVMPPNAPACRTTEAILRMYQKDAELNIEHVDASVAEDVRVSGDTAVAWGMDTGTTTPRSGGTPAPYSLKWLMVFERQSDGAWKCLYEMWNDNNPITNLP